MIPTTKNSQSGQHAVWLRRVAWLLGIWAASVAALALVAYLLRLFMTAAGLHT